MSRVVSWIIELKLNSKINIEIVSSVFVQIHLQLMVVNYVAERQLIYRIVQLVSIVLLMESGEIGVCYNSSIFIS